MVGAKQQSIWTLPYFYLLLINFTIFIIYYGLLTVLPIFVIDFIEGTTAQAGMTMAMFLVSAIIIRPFSGYLLEIVGKRRMLVISSIMYMLSTVLYLFVISFAGILLLRLFHGIWFSLLTTTASAIAADIIPKTKRGEGLGYFTLAMNLGMVLGPFLVLTFIQDKFYFFIYAVFSIFIGIGCIASMFIKLPAVNEAVAKPINKAFSLSQLFEKKAVPIAAFGSMIAFSYASIVAFISIYAEERQLLQAASFFYLAFAIAVIITRPLIGPFFDRRGPNFVIIPALCLYALGLLLLSVATGSTVLLAAAFFIGLGYGTLLPCVQAMAVNSAASHRSGHATATFFSFYDVGLAAGSYLLGFLVVMIGYANLYFSISLFVVILIVPYVLINKRNRSDQVEQEKIKAANSD